MEDTDWEVDADNIPQTLEEPLVEVSVWPEEKFDIPSAVKITDSNNVVAPSETTTTLSLEPGEKIYFFYSCLKSKSKRLQFIYVPKNGTVTFD
jgi:hypothetical protein